MHKIYKPKQKPRTNPYSEKPKNNYQTIYLEEYKSIILKYYEKIS